MKHNPVATANAVGITTAIVFVLCRILVGLFPDLSFAIAQSWLHGIQLTKLETWNLTFSSFLLGLVSSAITAWIIGYIFAKVYNSFIKR